MISIRRNTNRGFTLIELLVVIAIIGILAAMLFPAIQGALLQAKGTKAGSKMGNKGFAGLIYAESLDRNAVGQVELFPSDSGPTPYSDSTTYFIDMLTTVGGLTNQMDFSYFTLPGTAVKPIVGIPTDSANFAAQNNGWNVVLNLTTESNPQIPFLFTINIATEDTTTKGVADPPLNPTMDVLGREMGIIVYAQGAVTATKGKHLTDTVFNPSGAAFPYVGP